MNTRGAAELPLPIVAFFNAIPDENFLGVIRSLVHGTGHGFDDVSCTFPSDLDPNDEPFQGVAFWVYGADEAVVDLPALMIYVRLWCDQYLTRHPENASILQAILENADLSTSQAINRLQ